MSSTLQPLLDLNPRYMVITSDEHSPPSMDRGAWVSKPAIRGDHERAMEFVDAWCAEHKAEGIVRVSTGDTLDSFEPHPDRLRWLADYFERHLENCDAYLYIQGQHDRVVQCPDVTWLSVLVRHSKLHYMNQKVVRLGGTMAAFHDNTTPTRLMEFVQSLAEVPTNAFTLFCHQLWHPWVPSNRTSASLLAMPPYITSVISGDYHIQKDDLLVTQYGHQLGAWSVGPLTIQDISEPTACRFLVIDRLGAGSVTSIPVPCRPVFKTEVFTEEQLAEFELQTSRLPIQHDELSVDKPIVRLRYLTTVADAARRASAVCDMRAHLFLDPTVPTQVEQGQVLYSRHDKTDVFGCLDASGKAPMGSPVRRLVEEVLESTSSQDLEVRLNALRNSMTT